ncbi:hypothetical protein C8R32_10485 [Nitrosospira sp. Nsp5]|uniref:Uncharacterized protein n=1 Tax=Nitrosospira multiformis TaxID=1231 RepID=A0ABY0TE13_9PROT|nr:hypothetical protein C8R32_10485 [Nitrosospira sp. Nsp5]SDQ68854.1 hypothetical protein SAMN05216402_1864 [Nitrosospira multiformis]
MLMNKKCKDLLNLADQYVMSDKREEAKGLLMRQSFLPQPINGSFQIP